MLVPLEKPSRSVRFSKVPGSLRKAKTYNEQRKRLFAQLLTVRKTYLAYMIAKQKKALPLAAEIENEEERCKAWLRNLERYPVLTQKEKDKKKKVETGMRCLNLFACDVLHSADDRDIKFLTNLVNSNPEAQIQEDMDKGASYAHLDPSWMMDETKYKEAMEELEQAAYERAYQDRWGHAYWD